MSCTSAQAELAPGTALSRSRGRVLYTVHEVGAFSRGPPTLASGRVAVPLTLAERAAPFRQIPHASHTPPKRVTAPSRRRVDGRVMIVLPGAVFDLAGILGCACQAPMCRA